MIDKKRHGNARRMFLIHSEAHEIQLPRLSVGSLATLAAPPTLLSLDIPPPLTRRLLLVLTSAHPSHSLSPPPFPLILQIRGTCLKNIEAREKTPASLAHVLRNLHLKNAFFLM